MIVNHSPFQITLQSPPTNSLNFMSSLSLSLFKEWTHFKPYFYIVLVVTKTIVRKMYTCMNMCQVKGDFFH